MFVVIVTSTKTPNRIRGKNVKKRYSLRNEFAWILYLMCKDRGRQKKRKKNRKSAEQEDKSVECARMQCFL